MNGRWPALTGLRVFFGVRQGELYVVLAGVWLALRTDLPYACTDEVAHLGVRGAQTRRAPRRRQLQPVEHLRGSAWTR